MKVSITETAEDEKNQPIGNCRKYIQVRPSPMAGPVTSEVWASPTSSGLEAVCQIRRSHVRTHAGHGSGDGGFAKEMKKSKAWRC
jgi:hypothetical protein